MAKDIVYGLKEPIKFAPIPEDGKFPAPNAELTNAVIVPKIVMGSVAVTEEDGTETEIRVEDMDSILVVLDGEKPVKRMTFSTYDYSDKVMEFFLGFDKSQITGYDVFTKKTGYAIPNQFMQIATRPISESGSVIYQYMPAQIKVLDTTNLTKDSLAQIDFTITFLANTDPETGAEIPNERRLRANPEATGG